MGKHEHKIFPDAFVSLVYLACLIAGLVFAYVFFGGRH
jgi:ABC-type transporter Mla subunit MlaD